MTHEEIVAFSQLIGTLSAIAGFVFPVAIWALSRRFWKPKTRLSWALRFALWPTIIFSSQLGGPFVRMLFGLRTPLGRLSFGAACQGLVILGIVLGLLILPVGYLIARKKTFD